MMNLRVKGKRPVLWILSAMSIVPIALMRWWCESRSTAAEYLTAKIERGALRPSLNATGTLQVVTIVQIGSQVSGTIAALFADFNSAVTKGKVVAQLDPPCNDRRSAPRSIDRTAENLHSANAG